MLFLSILVHSSGFVKKGEYMSELEKEELRTRILNLTDEEVKVVCRALPSTALVNEIGTRLVALHHYSAQAKESLDKVVL